MTRYLAVVVLARARGCLAFGRAGADRADRLRHRHRREADADPRSHGRRFRGAGRRQGPRGDQGRAGHDAAPHRGHRRRQRHRHLPRQRGGVHAAAAHQGPVRDQLRDRSGDEVDRLHGRRNVLGEALGKVGARAATNDGGQLLSGIFEAAKDLEQKRAARSAILALTVGGEEHSPMQPHHVLDQLRKSGAALYVVSVAAVDPPLHRGREQAGRPARRESRQERSDRRRPQAVRRPARRNRRRPRRRPGRFSCSPKSSRISTP